MGTRHSKDINRLVIEIWCLCIEHNVWLKFSHIPGKDNITGDYEYEKFSRETPPGCHYYIHYLS